MSTLESSQPTLDSTMPKIQMFGVPSNSGGVSSLNQCVIDEYCGSKSAVNGTGTAAVLSPQPPTSTSVPQTTTASDTKKPDTMNAFPASSSTPTPTPSTSMDAKKPESTSHKEKQTKSTTVLWTPAQQELAQLVGSETDGQKIYEAFQKMSLFEVAGMFGSQMINEGSPMTAVIVSRLMTDQIKLTDRVKTLETQVHSLVEHNTQITHAHNRLLKFVREMESRRPIIQVQSDQYKITTSLSTRRREVWIDDDDDPLMYWMKRHTGS